ncbi:hypothetical protein J1N35_030068 [Gossypium stocksii]|uniref:Uncharacterized protein n=1 Tax=Gossypium stocksii TaxID=47602 RepID=A0A9D3UZ37_9ROSI|nr:hypothetical protein J1N35_030068 [Gossypium stocksii]
MPNSNLQAWCTVLPTSPLRLRGPFFLPLVMGNGEHTTIEMVDFLAVDLPMTYSAIFGRSIMRIMKIVVATFCMKTKFRTPTGERYMKADQKTT